MKLLLDENLSRKLAVRLSELYPGLVHVAEFGLLARPDYEVWERARRDGFIIVSTDSDFYDLATCFCRMLSLRRFVVPGWKLKLVEREDSTILSSVSETPGIRTKVSNSATSSAK